jgi:pimeloyl-ACP methyl ester carboxylesterase
MSVKFIIFKCFIVFAMNTILYKNVEISYSDVGKGSAIILLHGFLENQKMWSAIIPDFINRYRIITIDLLGHGDSRSLGYIHTMEENAEVVRCVISKLRIRKAIFVGHSMGGYVALAYADLFPNSMKALVLLNSTSKEDSDERKLNRDRAVLAVKKNHSTFIRIAVSNLFSEENRKKMLTEIDNVIAEALKTPLQGIVASLEGMKVRKDRESVLRAASFPTLLILGRKDMVLDCEEVVKQIENTNIELTVFADGHMSHIENRNNLKTVLLDFIKRI